jgi:GntR family transcriptional regulator/MocR family aminotransferase
MAERWATSVDLHVDLTGPDGRRAALERALRDAIRAGRLAAGDRLPSSRALAADLGVARGTVTDAYAQLTAEGWLAARQGATTTVAEGAGGTAHHTITPTRPVRPRHDFQPGSPDLSAFPRRAWAAAQRQVLRTVPDADLGYGEPFGHPTLRAALAAYLGRVRGVVTDAEHVLACSGWSQALDLSCRVLAARGVRTIGMEDPCIPHYRASVRANGLDIVPMPVDDDGARLDALGDAGAIVLTPAHQYPSGPTLAPERRTAAVEWARSTGGLIIEDDYDGELRYDRQPVGALQSLAPDHVVYVGTAAKSLAPGLRLGWVAVPEVLRADLTEAKYLADRNTSVLDQLTLAGMVTSGAYDRQLRRARLRYRRRRDLLLEALATRVPQLTPSGIAAGLHVLLDLDGREEEPIVEGLRAREVAVAQLSPSFHHEPSPRTGLVVGYGTPSEHAYQAALEALTTGLSELVGS